MSNYENIILEVKDGIARITLNRPNELNALNTALAKDLNHAVLQIQSDESVRVLIITGAGRAFSAGGDVKAMQNATAENLREELQIANRVIFNLVNLEIPVISAVNGYAVGAGFNIALAGDIIIASDQAKFSQIFVQVGLIPDLGGTYFLPRLIGVAKAKELVFTGRMIDADEAYQMGLVSRVVSAKEFAQVVEDTAQRLLHAPKSVGIAKRLINRSFDRDLETVLDYEIFGQLLASQTWDHKEGVRAFVEKRKPQFRGV